MLMMDKRRDIVRNNLATLNVGDDAYIHHSNAIGCRSDKTRVVRKTRTQLTTADGSRWFIDNGDKYGERQKTRGWFSRLATPAYHEWWMREVEA